MVRLRPSSFVLLGLLAVALAVADAHFTLSAPAACGGGLYNLTALSSTELQWTGRNDDGYNYTWYLRPCQ